MAGDYKWAYTELPILREETWKDKVCKVGFINSI